MLMRAIGSKMMEQSGLDSPVDWPNAALLSSQSNSLESDQGQSEWSHRTWPALQGSKQERDDDKIE